MGISSLNHNVQLSGHGVRGTEILRWVMPESCSLFASYLVGHGLLFSQQINSKDRMI